MRTGIVALSLAVFLLGAGDATARQAQPWQTLRTTAPLPPVKKTGQLKVKGAELYYAIYGEGRPVIMLHPALGNADYWSNQIGPLSQDFQVIVVDLRGHGRSTGVPLNYALLADDVVRLIKTLKLKEPAVVGWGDGAIVGLDLAIRYPKRIGRLVAFGMAFDRSGLLPKPDESSTFIDYVLRAQADHRRLSGKAAGFTATLDAWEALWEVQPAYSAGQLANLDTPTTIIAAQHDEWVSPGHMADAAAKIPDARLVILSKASHFAPWQTSKPFNDTLRAALAQ